MKLITRKELISTITRATRKPWKEIRETLLNEDPEDAAWTAITGIWKNRRVGDAVSYQHRMRKEFDRTSQT